VPEDLIGPALAAAGRLRDEIAGALAGAARGERLREGLVLAIAGPPNAGKSTLLNRLARREAAIVSPIPGTTRDVIEVHLDIGGYPVTVLDTAGIRDSDDPVEQEGVRRARQRAAEADLVLWVTDATAPSDGAEAKRAADSAVTGQGNGFPSVWIVRNKIDLLPDRSPSCSESEASANRIKDNNRMNESMDYNPDYSSSSNIFPLSASNGCGLDEMLSALERHVATHFGTEPALVTRERHRKALEATLASLDRALAEGSAGREDIIAEELRVAATSLGRLLGRVDVEDVLDAIFRDFCIGK